jgi:UDP-N-acetylglucosamine:LPS N-acetylglucosamine transferase
MPHILFAISDTGGGHRAAAQALTSALESLAGGAVICSTLDVLQASGCPVLRNAPALHAALSGRFLPLYDMAYASTNSPWLSQHLLDLAYACSRRQLRAALERERPQLVVAAHPLVTRLVARARAELRRGFGIVTLVTDLATSHASWALPGADSWVVPSKEARALLLDRGVPRERVALCPFPVHPRFEEWSAESARLAAKRQLGLDAAGFVVLLVGGGAGAGRLGERVALLRAALPGTQLLVVTGRNAALAAKLRAASLGPGVRIYAYVEDMALLMAASDVVLTKAGPGTLMEALCAGRPLVVAEAVGRQERGSIDYLLRRGAGAYCPSDAELLRELRRLQDPAAHAEACAASLRAAPRGGAFRVAGLLLEALEGQARYRMLKPLTAELAAC